MTVSDPVVLTAGRVRLIIDADVGGRAISWTIDDREILAHCGADPVEYGMYPMAPWAGRLRGNTIRTPDQAWTFPATYDEWALHGTVLADACTVVRATSDPLESSVHLSTPLRSPWPWAGECHMVWTLRCDGPDVTVRTRLEIVSTAKDSFPVLLGWHPWFRRGVVGARELTWRLPEHTMLVRGTDHLPTGAVRPGESVGTGDGRFDDAFHVPSGVATVQWPGWVEIIVTNSHPWFVVFDEREEAVCVEPQTGPPNGVNPESDVECVRATPNAPVVMNTTWTIRWLDGQPEG
jgi:aldose 1-epimerase